MQQQWRVGQGPRRPLVTSFTQAAIRGGRTRWGVIRTFRRLHRTLISTSLTLQFDNFTSQGLLSRLLLHSQVADTFLRCAGSLYVRLQWIFLPVQGVTPGSWLVGSSCGSQLRPRGNCLHALVTASAAPGVRLAMVLHTTNESVLAFA